MSPAPPKTPPAKGTRPRPPALTLQARLQYGLLILFVVSFPFYLFDSGGPQISTIFGALLVVLMLPAISAATMRPMAVPLLLFTLIALIVNFVNDVLWGTNFALLKFSVFYVYNFLVFVAVFAMMSKDGDTTARALIFGTLAALALQMALLPVSLTAGVRNSLFFNNPNQLGYWALLSASILAYAGALRGRRPTLLEVGGLVACVALVMFSQSKAAIAAIGVLILMRLGLSMRTMILGAIGMGVLLLLIDVSSILQVTEERFSRIGVDQDDNIWNRGYNRLFEYPEYLLFGFGEGAYWRINEELEAHSIFVTLIFSYGIAGFAAFAWFLIKAGGANTPTNLLYLLPTLIYGLTHQGLRFTILWVFLGVLAYGAAKALAERRAATRKGVIVPPARVSPHGATRPAAVSRSP